jgi:predicted protein tyrosine phosphatase
MKIQSVFTTGARIKRFMRDPKVFTGDEFCYDTKLVVGARILVDGDAIQSIDDEATVEIRQGFIANASRDCHPSKPWNALAIRFKNWQHSQPEYQVQVMSRDAIRTHFPVQGAVCISITNPRQQEASLQDGWTDILRLGFHDTDRPGGNFTPMTPLDAQCVIAFCDTHRDAPIVVHCEFGHSRSVAVGAFIAAWLGRELKLNTDVLNPNPWVIRQLRRQALLPALQARDWALLKVALRGPLARQYRYQMLPANVADSYR